MKTISQIIEPYRHELCYSVSYAYTHDLITKMLVEASEQAFNAGSEYGHDHSLSIEDGKPAMKPNWDIYLKKLTKTI